MVLPITQQGEKQKLLNSLINFTVKLKPNVVFISLGKKTINFKPSMGKSAIISLKLKIIFHK